MDKASKRSNRKRPNRKRDDLFQLVKSLTKAEKRSFTISAQKAGGKHKDYLKLFKLIDQQDEYDEAVLSAVFKSKRNLTNDKHRLYESILRTLRDQRSRKSYHMRIRDLLTDTRILFDRKHYRQAKLRLLEAKELADEMQDHLAGLAINLQMRRILKRTAPNSNYYREELEVLIKSQEEALSILHQEFELHDIYDRLSVFIKEGNPNADSLASIKEVADLILQEMPLSNASFQAQRRYHQARALFAQLSGSELPQLLSDFKSALASWQPYDKKRQEDFADYLGDAANVIYALHRIPGSAKEFNQQLEELEGLQPASVEAQRMLFEQTSIYRLAYHLNDLTTNFAPSAQRIIMGLQQYDLVPSAELSILYNLISLFVVHERSEDALHWINHIINNRRKYGNTRIDLQMAVRVIKLLLVYEDDDLDQIENYLRALRRYTSKFPASATKEFYQHLLPYFTRLLGVLPGQEKKVLQSLAQSIKEEKVIGPNGLDELTLIWIRRQ